MKTNATATAATEPSRVSALLRRVGMTAGLSFGFVLLALVVAGEANASEDSDSSSTDEVTGVLDELVTPVAEELSEVTEPVEEIVAPVAEEAEPVATPVAEAVQPVTEPVLEPVSTAVEPVVESVLTPIEPITDPVLDAGEPVLDPVVEAAGLEPVVSPLEEEATPPLPELSTDPQPESEPTLERPFTVQADPANTAPTIRDAPTDDHRTDLSHGSFGPTGEIGFGVTVVFGVPNGSHTALGGLNNSPAADNALATGWPSQHFDPVPYRGPPHADSAVHWFAYDDRDHPG